MPAPKRLELTQGTPSPLGNNVTKNGVNFALFSAHATKVTLCLFSDDGRTETAKFDLPERTGDIWHGSIKGLKAGQLYGYRVYGPYEPQNGHRFNPHKLLIDPYAKDLFGEFILDDALYGFDRHSEQTDLSFDSRDSAPFMPKCVIGDIALKWGSTQRPKTPLEDSIIYEAHIKGVTKLHPKIKPAHRGTLSGLSDPAIVTHLKELGVTAIELLPVQSFFSEPRLTEMGLTNYWGYNPVNYFAMHAPYLGPNGHQSWADAVSALHKAGIEVILDVVYNHTAESWELGPTLSYRGIDNVSYYQLQDDRRYYVNHTGCGNTLNMAHPQVLELTLQSLRYYVEVMKVDGFRFDLGPTLGRNPNDYDPNAAFFRAIAEDPILSKVKMIAEPWDIGPHGYQLGNFPQGWSEWNDQYRDTVRSFWKGDQNAHQSLAGKLLASADIFENSDRPPQASVNFIAAHDGFTLRDTVSYNHKHNMANGEDNRDGHSHNLSDNMGAEGPTDNAHIKAARQQRQKNILATLMLSQGVPMMLGGDEFGQSMQGNNNAYCQDNKITWLDWEAADEGLMAFTKDLIALRKASPHFKQTAYLHGEEISKSGVPNVQWLSSSGEALKNHEWENAHLASFAMALSLPDQDTFIVVFNRGEACEFNFGGADLTMLLTTSEEAQMPRHIAAHTVSVLKSNGTYQTQSQKNEAIQALANQYGLVESYRNLNGHVHALPNETRDEILNAMGISSSEISGSNSASEIVRKSDLKVYGRETLQKDGGVWGVTCALYGLRSARNWGIGDFEDLAVLCEIMGRKGADFIGINPVHALFPSAPHLYAPYSPSSRQFLNVMCIAPDKIPDFQKTHFPALDSLRASETVDYASVYPKKMKAFESSFQSFLALPSTHKRRKGFSTYLKNGGESLHRHALFEVLFETQPKSKQTYDGWKNFPKKYQDPNSKACLEFAAKNENRITFYSYLQWTAETQLQDAQARAKKTGMSIGLYIDFAVGVVPGSADAWKSSQAFAQGISLGAPGDMANPDGQKWNLVPFNPHELIKNNYEPYRTALRKSMKVGGAVRIDHILGHLRSFWIPQDQSTGGYVRYPFDGLLQMIAEESQANNCVVFGEDLGTVPDRFRDRMAQYDLMGCNVALIERDSQGHIIAADNLRDLSMTSFSNHDFPTLAGFWEGEDFRWREDLGIGDNEDALAWEKSRRENDKSKFLDMINWPQRENVKMDISLMAALQAYLARSPALAFAVQLDDLLLEPLQANVPGTTDEQPNWRRRARLTLEEIASDEDIDHILNAVHTARKR